MALFLVTAPAIEPLTIAEIKAHLKIDSTSGEPVPSVITVALANPAVAGNVTAGAHRYCATFVTADGETNAGDLSAIVTVADAAVNGKVELTAIPLGGSAVTQRKLYRTTAGGTTYLLLATLSDNTTTVYTDNVADGSLGAAVPSVNTTADPELIAMIQAAREYCETFTHRAFITQTWDLKLDGFPAMWSQAGVDERQVDLGAIWVPKPPLVSVTSVSYVDTAGAAQTWASSNYTVDAPVGDKARMGRIVPAWSIYYPVARAVPNAVTVRFVAGYGAAASTLPKMVNLCMKEHVRANYGRGNEDREEIMEWIGEQLWPYKAF